MVVGDGRPVSIAWADGRCDFQGRCAERQSSLAPGWRRVVAAGGGGLASGRPALRPEADT